LTFTGKLLGTIVNVAREKWVEAMKAMPAITTTTPATKSRILEPDLLLFLRAGRAGGVMGILLKASLFLSVILWIGTGDSSSMRFLLGREDGFSLADFSDWASSCPAGIFRIERLSPGTMSCTRLGMDSCSFQPCIAMGARMKND
jgi:hypothetical protein